MTEFSLCQRKMQSNDTEGKKIALTVVIAYDSRNLILRFLDKAKILQVQLWQRDSED